MAYNAVPTAYDGAPAWTSQFVNKYIRDNFAAGVPDIFAAKGDIAGATAADAAGRLAVGTNGLILSANSAQATGLQWIRDAAVDMIETEADLIVGTAADAADNLKVPTDLYNTDFFDGNILYADSGETLGVRWGYPWAAAQFVAYANQVGSNNTGTVKLANYNSLMYTLGQQADLANDRFVASTAAKYLVVAYCYVADNSDHSPGSAYWLELFKNGSHHQTIDGYVCTGDPGVREFWYHLNGTTIVDLDADDYIELYLRRDVGATVVGQWTVNAVQSYVNHHWSVQQLVVV